MRIGIVGHEAAKFTTETETAARAVIRSLLHPGDVVISGACHLGGIDIWAVEEAKRLGLEWVEHAPTRRTWSGEGGFMDRNLRIARDAERVVCIVVDRLPTSYRGMRWPSCYHCHTDQHVKSGGCWTVKQARAMGKLTDVIVVPSTSVPF